ncbi:hypothetical protein C8R44DRAFT_760246 [Mycena epipterygia]|nr:hypothetical protein C8R44DRAFT_760246 [Mycena epipterygia]
MLIQLFQRRLHCTASLNAIINPCITRIARPPKMRHHHGRAVEFSNRVDVPHPGATRLCCLRHVSNSAQQHHHAPTTFNFSPVNSGVTVR